MSQLRTHRTANCWCGHGGTSHYGGGERAGIVCAECERQPMDSELPLLVEDRRRFDRFALPHPLRTSVGKSPAYVVDASLAGLGVLQHDPAPPVGSPCRLMFYSEFGPITLECGVVRTSGTQGNETPRQTGLRIVAADTESEARLRAMVMSLAVPLVARSSGH